MPRYQKLSDRLSALPLLGRGGGFERTVLRRAQELPDTPAKRRRWRRRRSLRPAIAAGKRVQPLGKGLGRSTALRWVLGKARCDQFIKGHRDRGVGVRGRQRRRGKNSGADAL